jgi:BlaI family transcriptional regulator, penicillinase repressor
MPAKPPQTHLSRRERQILDVLYRRGPAGVTEIQAGLPKSPGYSAVRALLRILEEKGHVKHRELGARYVYAPTISPDKARRSALLHVLQTFFNGSPEQAMATLLDVSARDLSPEELDRMAELIAKARKEGR